MINKKPMIHVKNFSKNYGDFQAVKDISFDVFPGEVFGFVGTNGAGKSTTINTLCTIQPKTSGEVLICDHDVETEKDLVRKDIGVVFQDMALDKKLTVEEILKLHCELYDVPKKEVDERIDFVLDLVELTEVRSKKVKSLSGGMQRRVEIARGIVHFPKVLFLDEPTTGLDPRSRENVWKYILKLQKEKGTTIFLTTHYMEEAEYCTHIAIMQKGKITAFDTPSNLKQKYTRTLLDMSCSNKEKVMNGLRKAKIKCYPVGDKIRAEVETAQKAVELLSFWKEDIIDFEFKHGTLNEVFLGITGNKED